MVYYFRIQHHSYVISVLFQEQIWTVVIRILNFKYVVFCTEKWGIFERWRKISGTECTWNLTANVLRNPFSRRETSHMWRSTGIISTSLVTLTSEFMYIFYLKFDVKRFLRKPLFLYNATYVSRYIIKPESAVIYFKKVFLTKWDVP